MALIRIDHTPQTVKVNLPLNIIVPDPGKMNGIPVRQRKVLYLLHGLSDDSSAWQRYTAIETIASAYGLVVVMPSVSRSFYTDQPNGQNYFSYLIEELPQYLSDVFNLTPKREDTLIAGVSMGGYGAMKVALLYPERFYAAASFSGLLSLRFLEAYPNDPRQKEFTFIFSDLSKLSGSDHDPAVWLKNAAKNPSALPQLHIACGIQDDLYPLNQLFQAECTSLGINLNYHVEDGKHEWLFWDAQIRRFLASVLGPPAFL
jgi:S-formylglutathione hydrolase FrmB